MVESEAFRAAAPDGRSQAVEGISLCFASVAFLDPPVLGDDVKVVALSSSGEGGVGVLAGGGVVGEDAGLRVHDLRHTSVSLLIELGAHPKVIQERLGHSSITVTMDVYGHLFPSLAEALTERLDDVFREARASHVDPTPASVVALR